ncbi:MAG: pyridoxine 5'-phosphate synthase [Phycisphaeraceae bacterium]
MAELGLNIDHVATVREARRAIEPDPVWAAVEAQLGGAECITMHLREDRRHIQDHDVERVKSICQVKLNLEIAATDEMVRIAARVRPYMATLVPEGRQELTTEGGLDVAGQRARLKDVVAKLHEAGVLCSAFIDPQPSQIEAAAGAGFDACEMHTGPYAHAIGAAGHDANAPAVAEELAKVAGAGRQIIEARMRFNAGHALNYTNVQPIAALPGMWQLHIGHSIVSRAIFVGLRAAVEQMIRLISPAAGAGT